MRYRKHAQCDLTCLIWCSNMCGLIHSVVTHKCNSMPMLYGNILFALWQWDEYRSIFPDLLLSRPFRLSIFGHSTNAPEIFKPRPPWRPHGGTRETTNEDYLDYRYSIYIYLYIYIYVYVIHDASQRSIPPIGSLFHGNYNQKRIKNMRMWMWIVICYRLFTRWRSHYESNTHLTKVMSNYNEGEHDPHESNLDIAICIKFSSWFEIDLPCQVKAWFKPN